MPLHFCSRPASALNIFSAVEADVDNGREIYRLLIEEIEEDEGFLEALNRAGLTSPFEESTFESIISTMLK